MRAIRAAAALLACAAAAAAVAAADAGGELVVRTRQGTVRGRVVTSSATGCRYRSFQGIPYGRPPTGELRFKGPEPAGPWEGPLDCTREGSVCPQPSSGGVIGDEDCLHVNVYAPEEPQPTPLPTMVWIHGGGFATGSGSTGFYGPDFLLEHGGGVIIVSINYRLGVLGFLDLDLPDAPGNAGLKDQTLALRWVKDNIAAFGGDPGNVTIFGQSAGAASVHFHMLLTESKGLFQRAIAQSGTAVSSWAFRNSTLDNAQVAAERAGCPGSVREDPAAAAACLRATPLQRLVAAGDGAYTPQDLANGRLLPFLPTLDDDWLPAEPQALIQQGCLAHVPFLTGVTDAEGLMLGPNLDTPFGTLVIDSLLRHCVPLGPPPPSDAACPAAAAALRRRYFGAEPGPEGRLAGAVELLTDWWFVLPAVLSLRMHANYTNQPQYLYEFVYEGAYNLVKQSKGKPQIKGACHADDLFYIFYMSEHVNKKKQGTPEAGVIHHMTQMWTNFAKHGHPTPDGAPADWKPFTPEEPNYLKISGQLQPMLEIKPGCEEFWDRLRGGGDGQPDGQ